MLAGGPTPDRKPWPYTNQRCSYVETAVKVSLIFTPGMVGEGVSGGGSANVIGFFRDARR